MGVFKEIAKADGSGTTTFYRLSSEEDTVETTSTDGTSTMIDYNSMLNKPSINDVALVGNKTLEDLGIQPAGNYLTAVPEEYITEEELEAKDYATETFVMEQINNTEHFHRETVDALPLTGKDNVLYLVPKKGSDKDIYNEYIWTGTDYEFMGTTAVDLTDYYKKSEVDELLDTKVNKVDGKQLSTNDYTTAEKTKLASLENYDDGELRSKVDALHNYDDTAVRLDIQELKRDTSTNEIDITSIENELGYKAEVIRLVKNGDWWLCQDAKGNNLTLEMAMNRLGLPKTILLLENLENDGKYYPVEYELKEKYIDIIYKDLEGITHHLNYGYNEYYTNTASGDYIHLEDSINYPYKELGIDGVCEQETTSGKNLAEIIDITKTIDNSLNYTAQNGEIKLNGTLSANSNMVIGMLHLEANTDYYLSINKSDSLNGSYLIINDNGTFIYFGSDKTFQVSQTKDYELSIIVIKGTYNNLTLKPQAELGTIKTSWEPYTGGQSSPSPDYPQEVKTIENNLEITSYNKNLLVNRLIVEPITQNGVTIIPNKDGTFTINGTADKSMYFDLMIEKKLGAFNLTNIGSSVKSLTVNGYTLSASISNGIVHLGHNPSNGIWSIAIPSGTIYDNAVLKAQLERGVQATPLEQHLGTQITANLPEEEFIGKLDDIYKDTLKVEYNEEDGNYHLNLYKNIGKGIVAHGGFYDGGTWKGYYVTIPNKSKKSNNCLVCDRAIFDKLANKTENTVYENADNVMFVGNADDTLETLQQKFNGAIIYYVLATPYVVDLGIVDMPITYDSVTNLFTDSDLMPTINVEYYTEILENAKDNVIGQDIYLQDEVDTLNDLPTKANKGDIRKVKDTESWYIYDGIIWSAFDKASEIDLSNYLPKDNTIPYAPSTDYNPATKRYVDTKVDALFIPTKTSQLTNDSGFVLKSVNDLTNYYNKSNTYNKAEVNALVNSSGGITKDTIISTLGYTPYDSANPSKYISKIPTASSTVLGGVKIGNNLSIDANGVLSASAAGITEEEVNGIIDNYGTKVNLQVGDKLGEKALSYEFPNDIENSINASTETLCSTTYDSGGIIMISTYSNKLQYRYIDDGGGLSTQELCTISNGAIGDLINIPKFDIKEVNTNHYLYPYLFFKNQPILDRIDNLEEKITKDTAQLTIELAINGPSISWTAGTDNFTINYTNGDGKFVSEKWYPTDITSNGENKVINIAKGTVFSITSTRDMHGLRRYGRCTNIQSLAASTTSTEVTCFIYKNGSIEFADGEPL